MLVGEQVIMIYVLLIFSKVSYNVKQNDMS